MLELHREGPNERSANSRGNKLATFVVYKGNVGRQAPTLEFRGRFN
jgi:hypothetical protein